MPSKKFVLSLCSRLIQNAADWIGVHGQTPWTNLPGFDPWRIYPDMLHVLDLPISPDSIASILLFEIDGLPNRDTALFAIGKKYFTWASEMKLDAGYLANPKLFSQKILKASSAVYPSISQKFLKGAAARMMTYFICGLVCERANQSDVLRDKNPGPKFIHFCVSFKFARFRFSVSDKFQRSCCNIYVSLNFWTIKLFRIAFQDPRHMANLFLGLCGFYTVVAESTSKPEFELFVFFNSRI